MSNLAYYLLFFLGMLALAIPSGLLIKSSLKRHQREYEEFIRNQIIHRKNSHS